MTRDPDLVAGAGGPPRRTVAQPLARRIGAFLVWWALLMAVWVWVDDSIATAELAVGAAAAALGALCAEVVLSQADTHIRLRFEWLAGALTLPWQVVRDTAKVVGATWRTVATGVQPPSELAEIPVRVGDDSPDAVTRRVLLVAGTSVAPNTYALGIDAEQGVMLVHRLVGTSTGGGPRRRRA